MDLLETIVPKSDQQNYDDYIGGSRTVTVSAVTKGSVEQPVSIELVEYPGRPYKPNKSMRRVLVVAWGPDSAAYVGRRLTLVGNPNVVFGGKTVGGIEIAAVSDIAKPVEVNLTVTRGRKAIHKVEPLPASRDWLSDLRAAGTDLTAIAALGKAAQAEHAPAAVVDQIRGEYKRIQAAQNGGE